MTKECVTQLYSFTAKLMPLLEREIDLLQNSGDESAIDVKRNVTETLGKLVGLLTQLNKLKQEEGSADFDSIGTDDQAIIERFFEKHPTLASLRKRD